MTKYNFIIDVEKCEDCNNCFLACKDEHVDNTWPGITDAQPRHGHRWMNIMRNERGTFPLIDVAYRPTPCMHCDDAPCIAASSPGKIVKREDGIVLIDPEKARGDKSLLKSCPYGVIYWNEEANVAQKCTLCAHLIDAGWTQPRCAQVCPTGALKFLKTDDTDMEKIVKAQDLEILSPELKTSPRVYYKNLHLFKFNFIAGSVAVQTNDIKDCAQGASVTLKEKNTVVAQVLTDEFGDYRFDGIDPDCENLTIEVVYNEFENQIISIEAVKSMTLPDIVFK